VATTVAVGCIAYAWSTLVDLLRKLERVRQTAVADREANGGVPTLSPEARRAAAAGEGDVAPSGDAEAQPLDSEPGKGPADIARAWVLEFAKQTRRVCALVLKQSRRILDRARSELSAAWDGLGQLYAESAPKLGARMEAAWTGARHALAKGLTDEQLERVYRLGATSFAFAAVGLLAYEATLRLL
jgi:hypothetical protein